MNNSFVITPTHEEWLSLWFVLVGSEQVAYLDSTNKLSYLLLYCPI